MIAYRVLSIAEEEAGEAIEFYDDKEPGLGALFLDDLNNTITKIRRYPQIGEITSGEIRRTIFHRFPYYLFYAVENEKILVISIAHQRRKPNYWRDRTK